MSHESFDDLTEVERGAFGALPRDAAPPPALEERVVAALKERGLIQSRRSSALRFGVPIGALAAAVLLFAAGLAVGRRAGAHAPADPRPEFVLFLQEGKDFDRGFGAADEHVAEYKAWAQALGRQGLIVAGEKLKEEGLFVEKNGSETFIGAEKVLGSDVAPRGYFVIRARDLDQALAIAKDCPHVKHGGRISLRPIDKV
jgi:hypothetical protein